MKEKDIRDIGVLNEYLRKVEKDVKDLFDFGSFAGIGCPACGGNSATKEFEKIGFRYVSCNDCATLFANPRPRFEDLDRFYSDSPSTAFWVNKFFRPMAEKRREKIFAPRAARVSRLAGGKEKLTIGDIGAGFGLFLEELRKLRPDDNYVAIEPSDEMAKICEGKKLEVINACLEEAEGREGRFDILTAFELLEHLSNPETFLRRAHSLLKPGGRLILSALNGRGFDIMLLWSKSKCVMPPHHLNFFNPSSVRLLLERTGFKVEEVSTPGKLDWDIVEGMIKNEGADVGRFWKMLAKEGSSACKEDLQDWITKNNLSSHMNVVARKGV